MPEKEEAEAVVLPHHQAHDAVAVVDLQGWQARGLARDPCEPARKHAHSSRERGVSTASRVSECVLSL